MNDSELYKMAQREINIKEVLFSVLLKWRTMLVWAICMAVLLGGYSYISSSRNYGTYENSNPIIAVDSIAEELQRQIDDLEEDIDKVEKLSISEMVDSWPIDKKVEFTGIQNFDKLIEQHKDYLQNSLSMKIDTNQTYNLVLGYYVDNHYEYNYSKTFPYNELTTILNYYQLMDTSNDLNEAVSTAIATKAPYVDELLTYTWNASMITISMKLDSEENAKRAITAIKDLMETYHSKISEKIEAHDLTLEEEKIYSSIDKNLSVKQTDNMNTLAYFINQKTDYYNRLNKEVQLYYDFLTEELNEQKTLNGMHATRSEEIRLKIDDLRNQITAVRSNITIEKPTISIKYIILGFILGLFIEAFIGAFFYISSNKLHTSRDLELCYDVPMLGTVFYENEKKKFLSIVDRWMVKIRNNNKIITKEISLKLITTRVRLFVQKNNLHGVLITGIYMGEHEIELARKIQNIMEKFGIEVVIGKSMIYDSETMEKAGNIGAVILMETVGKSLYSEIDKEIYYCLKTKIVVIGSIAVEEVG